MIRMLHHLAQTPLLKVSGGATESVFPKIDAMLKVLSFHDALEFVAAKKQMDRYESMVDFFFCEIWIEFQPACMKYYKRLGPPLRDLISGARRTQYECLLVGALALAYQKHKDRATCTWTEYRQEILKRGGMD